MKKIIISVVLLTGGMVVLSGCSQDQTSQNNQATKILSEKSKVNQVAEAEGYLLIDEIKIKLPSDWKIEKKESDKIYIKDNKLETEYNTLLTVKFEKNPPAMLDDYKNGKNIGFDNMKDEKNEIFKNACSGIACNGVIYNGDIYYFVWAVETDQPAPENLKGSWEPEHHFNTDNIWEMLKTIIVQ